MRTTHPISAVLAGIAAVVICSCGGSGGAPTSNAPVLTASQVRTDQGIYDGEISGDLLVLRGVPYAAAPIAELRFKPPQALASFSGVRQAKAFGAICPQANPNNGTVDGNDDCLTLNIWQPSNAANASVLVFIHGGGFLEGSGSSVLYDGASLAEETGSIVVTLNYRLGALGFLATNDLIAESPDSVAGNYGLLDQIAALNWVQGNIIQFGGDPDQVLVFGESAGAVSICGLLAAPTAQGLFAAAVVQSGPCGLVQELSNTLPSVPSAVETGAQFVDAVGCGSAGNELDCLRSLSASDLVTAEQSMPRVIHGLLPFPPLLPNVDGVVISAAPLAAVANGIDGDIPLIVGANDDEAATFLSAFPVPDDEAYRMILDAIFDAQADAIYSIYPTAAFADAKAAFVALAGDLSFNCSSEALANAASGGNAAYLYQFSRRWDNGSFAEFGAFHGIELPYLFSSFSVFSHTPTPEDFAVATEMKMIWSNFATGNAGSGSMAAYFRAAPVYTDFDSTAALVSTNYRGGRCNQLRDLGLVP